MKQDQNGDERSTGSWGVRCPRVALRARVEAGAFHPIIQGGDMGRVGLKVSKHGRSWVVLVNENVCAWATRRRLAMRHAEIVRRTVKALGGTVVDQAPGPLV